MPRQPEQDSRLEVEQSLAEALESLPPGLYSENTIDYGDREALRSFLQQFYLREVTGLTLTDDVEDHWRFVQEQFRTALSAAYLHHLTIATVLSSDGGQIKLYIGVKASGEREAAFRQTLGGVLPGLHLQPGEDIQFSELLQDRRFGGTVSGVPTLRADDERQRFSLGSVARALRGRSFTLAIVSTPVNESERNALIKKLLDVRDLSHEQARKTSTEQTATSEAITTSTSENRGGPWIRVPSRPSFPSRWSEFRIWLSVFRNKGSSTSEANTRQFVESQSREQQNGLAVELEQLADYHLDRLKRAVNTGYWETAVAYAAESMEDAELLGGAFAAELAKPNELGVPPRILTGHIPDEGLLPVSLASQARPGGSSFITSEELALVSAPPSEMLPGYDVRLMPRLSLTDPKRSGNKLLKAPLGHIVDQGSRLEHAPFSIGEDDLVKHIFVCGLTGSGKSTTVKQLLKSAYTSDEDRPIPFLVLESAKRDYRRLLSDPAFKDSLRIYTIGDATVAPFRLNPFFVLPGASVAWHIDFLKALFQASFSFYGPMPSIIEKCLNRIYLNRGWNLTLGTHPHLHNADGTPIEERFYTTEGLRCFPILDDLKQEVDKYIRTDLEYKGELSDNIRTAILVRLDSLCSGAKGLMLNTYETTRIDKLLRAPTVLELEPLADDDDKAFFLGLVLLLVSEYRQLNSQAVDLQNAGKGLRHVLVLEEAHRLLKNVTTERQSEMMGNPKGKAVDSFCNAVAEMRSLGQGVVVVEQVPVKIAPDVIKNANTKIAHRIVSGDDQALLASTLGLKAEEAAYLSLLETGRALCHKQGMARPVEVDVDSTVTDRPIVHSRVRRQMQSDLPSDASLRLPDFASAVRPVDSRVALRLLNTMLSANPETVIEAIAAAKGDLKLACERRGVEFDSEVASLHILDSMLNQIGHGVYSNRFKLPERISEHLLTLLREETPNESMLLKVKESMAAHFEMETSRTLCIEQNKIQLKGHAARSNKRMTDGDLAAEADQLFYHQDPSLIADLVLNTRQHLESLYATT